ncbi:MAG: sulfite exporter TauE/SafE family protein [Candidatus Heimdallarchaeota archaeon]
MAITPLIFISLVIVGFFIGIIAAMVGIGGGALVVPILIFFYGLSTPQASATSSFVIIFTAGSGTLTYLRQRRIDLRSGFFLAVVAIPFALVGAFLAETTNEDFLTVTFGVFLILLAIQKLAAKSKSENSSVPLTEKSNTTTGNNNGESGTITKKRLLPQPVEPRLIIDDKNEQFRYEVKLYNVIKWGFIGGLMGGMLGIGGGVIFVPVLSEIGGIPPHIAVATSTFVVLFNALSSSVGRFLFGENIIFDFVLPLAIGTVSGARLGALRVRRISARRIIMIFYLIVLFVGVRAILRGLGLF